MTVNVKVEPGGRITLPESIQHELGIHDGDTVQVRVAGETLELDTCNEPEAERIRQWEERVARAQALFRESIGDYQGSMVDELIAERRREAALE